MRKQVVVPKSIQEPLPRDLHKVDPNQPIDYRYLDLDAGEFCADAKELAQRFRRTPHLCRVIPSDPRYNQMLVAASIFEFTKEEAIKRCRQLTGILPADD